jgi:hypothetical protein
MERYTKFSPRPTSPDAASSYDRKVSRVGKGFAGAGFVLGVVAMATFAIHTPPQSLVNVFELVAGVIFATVFFWGVGFAVVCGVAPRAYLNSAEGQARLAKIGTKSVMGARIACASYLLFIAAVVGFVLFMGRR